MTDSTERHRPRYVLYREVVATKTRSVACESGLVNIARFDLMTFGALQSLVLRLAMGEASLFPADNSLPLRFYLRLKSGRRLQPTSRNDRQRRQSQQSNSIPECFQPVLPMLNADKHPCSPTCNRSLPLPFPVLVAVTALDGSLF